MDLPRYYLVGSWARPVMVIETAQGGMTVKAFDWETGEFKTALIYGNTLFASTDDVQRVSESEFEESVRQERANLQPGQTDVAARKLAVQQSKIWLESDERMKERLEEYEWQAERILNFAHQRFVFESVAKLYKGLDLLAQQFTEQGISFVRLIDRIISPLDDGYRDVLANVEMPNGHIAEMRLELKEIHDFSTDSAQPFYDEIRSINKNVTTEQREYSAEEKNRIGYLQALLRPTYEDLFRQATAVELGET